MFGQLKNLYENELKIPHNDICKSCDAKVKHPLLPWVVGSKYFSTKEKILFVGKPHRGIPGEKLASSIIDPQKMFESKLKDKSWAYWSYTKKILSKIYSKNEWDYCAFTNIIKCTNVDSSKDKSIDTTSRTMAEFCIEKLGVIHKEIEILKPNHIVFYTKNLYPEYIEELPFGKDVKEITSKSNKVKCGKKDLAWWERTVSTKWNNKVKIIVIGHPERMKKDDYVSLVVNWVKKN